MTEERVQQRLTTLVEWARVGPPLHQKGQLVFMEYDQVELDAAYDQGAYAH